MDDERGILCMDSLLACCLYLNVWKLVPKKVFIIPTVVVSTTKSLLGVANTEYIVLEGEDKDNEICKYLMMFFAGSAGSCKSNSSSWLNHRLNLLEEGLEMS